MKRDKCETKPEPEAPAVKVPEAFERTFGLDLEPPVRDGLRIVAAGGLDAAGFTKERRYALRAAWEGWRLGGGTADVQRRIGTALAEKAQAQRRIEAAPVGKAELKANLEAHLPGIDAQVAADQELLNVAGDAVGDNQVTRRSRAERLRRDLEVAKTRLAGFHAARRLVGDDQDFDRLLSAREDRVVRLEAEVVTAERLFDEGAALLAEANKRRQDHERKARSALAATLERYGAALGLRALETVKGVDVDLIERFPHRCPDDAVALYGEAQAAAGVAGRLDPKSDCIGAFQKATGERLFDVLMAAAGERPGRRRESWPRPPKPSPDPIMREAY